MLFNLKQFSERDGIPKDKVSTLLQTNQRQSIRLIEKSVCRLFCYKDQELYLMPLCLDRWKQWVQHRKAFRYWLDYLNKRVDPQLCDIFSAFRKWKMLDSERKKALEKLKKSELEKLCVKSKDTMNDLDRNLNLADLT
jgi:hypothetical protein